MSGNRENDILVLTAAIDCCEYLCEFLGVLRSEVVGIPGQTVLLDWLSIDLPLLSMVSSELRNSLRREGSGHDGLVNGAYQAGRSGSLRSTKNHRKLQSVQSYYRRKSRL